VPSLNSSSCYPLVNFTRPFCKNHGVILSSYVYRTPFHQNLKNNELHKDFRAIEKLGLSKLSRIFSIDVVTLRKCLQFLIEIFCRDLFPSCDWTQSVFLEQKICRESCLETTRICSKMYRFIFNYYTEQHPESKKKFRCELQPYRNAGDSPECYYVNGLANTPGTIQGPVVRKSDNFITIFSAVVKIHKTL
jgi:hypothetical protein